MVGLSEAVADKLDRLLQPTAAVQITLAFQSNSPSTSM